MVESVNDVRTFLMVGHPGSGKGTQGKLLAKKIGAEVYSSGSRLREMAKGTGFVNQKIKRGIESGDLLPAWLSSHLFVDVLLGLSQEEGIVFEGACRTEAEAQAFNEAAEWLGRPYRVLFLKISDSEVEKRLALRKNIEGRADDASDSIEHRLREYEQKTMPAVTFFKSRNVLIEINGEQTVEAVHSDVLKALAIS